MRKKPEIYFKTETKKENIMDSTTGRTEKLTQKFGHHPRDTGSSEVQIALLTDEIQSLTEHMKGHSKDFRSQRSLTIKVSRRRKLLEYLKRTNPESYHRLVAELNLRK
jgi:small subunit ribosomal protein S15